MNFPFEIRQLTEQDAQAVYDFRKIALETDPWAFAESLEELAQISVDEYAARLRSSTTANFIIGAFQENALVGTTGFYQDKLIKRQHKGNIWGVFVLPPARGQGLGRALVLRTIETAKSIPGLDQILLTVSLSQHSARSLYIACGFRPIGIEPRGLKIGDQTVDEEHLVLDLAKQTS